ncbi:MAG: ATP synthase F0 subunit C [Oligoflexales bacterium]|nr:ATP synthase F0 subunit C [Oligoflexales bacterium]
MKLFLKRAGFIFGGLVLSTLALAEDGAVVSSQAGLIAIASGLAVGLATFGAASSQGKAAAAALEGIARNPNSKNDVFTPFILGLAFMEFQAILGFLIAFLLFGKV